MAFNHETGHFVPGPRELLPAQVTPMVYEMEPGNIFYVNGNDVLIARNRLPVICKFAHALDMSEVISKGCNDPDTTFVRIIATHNGPIIDLSHLNKRDWTRRKDQYQRSEADLIAAAPDDYIMAHDIVHNPDELALITEPLAEQYNIVLGRTDLRAAFDEIKRLTEGDEDEEEFARDDWDQAS